MDGSYLSIIERPFNISSDSSTNGSPPLKKPRLLPKRLPLSDISPHATSKPVQIPRISVHRPDDDYDTEDEVFDESSKENICLSSRKILFPSFGTSPSKGYRIDSPNRKFQSNLLEDSTIKKLGKGSYGTVVLGSWRGERVAIKVIRRRSSIENEKNALLLRHENVTKIKEIIDEQDDDEKSNAILVLEYVGQHSMQALIEQNPTKLTSKLTKSFLLQAAKGLKHCHDNLIVHLDIKPSNILVTSTGYCKIADFGCSQKLAHKLQQIPTESESFGTPGYQAPELFKEKVFHLKCDVFSFGIMMWQLLSKEKEPFPKTHPHVIIYKMVSIDHRPSKEPPKIWKLYEPLYKSCWMKDFRSRPEINSVLKQLVNLGKSHGSSTSSRKSSGIRI